jgi:glycylpeptide N-tetradecanoyltransferase
MHIQFTPEEVQHFFLPREWVIESFVVEDPNNDEITDFFSFYSLPSSVLKHPVHNNLNVAYQYYYFNNKHNLTDLMKDALILAKEKGYDVFNALDIMKNEEFLKEHRFGVGDGNLHYYFYNWRVQKFNPQEVGVVLV